MKFLPWLLLISGSGQVLAAEPTALKFTSDRSKTALSQPYADMSDDAVDQFALGRSFFTIPWVEAPSATTARDGLGPLFNANSCASCHPNNGAGNGLNKSKFVDRSLVIKLHNSSPEFLNSTNFKTSGFSPDPVYGAQLAVNGTSNVPLEGRVNVTLTETKILLPDGTRVDLQQPKFKATHLNYGPMDKDTTLNPRRAPALIGLGLIDAIPEQQILKFEDINDENGDGISGKANHVWSLQFEQFQLGRYGWKASTPSVIEQTAQALSNDMGLTTPWLPAENCSQSQVDCNQAYRSKSPDVPMKRLQAISYYLSHLRAPHKPAKKSAQLFQKIGCGSCHRSGYRTSDGIEVDPYSDFLLHDMGPQLADNSRVFLANPNEWRTPPLWGIGLQKTLNAKTGYLHDGRASSLLEAVLWHGGEAKTSREAFTELSAKQRENLLGFLRSL